MKTNEKRIIFLTILIVVVIIVLGVLFRSKHGTEEQENEITKNNVITNQENTITEQYATTLPEGTKLNKSQKLLQTKQFDGIEFSRIQLTYQNGQSIMLAQMKNISNENKALTKITFKLLDEQGNAIKEMKGLIPPMKVGQTRQFNISMADDYSNAYDFTIEKTK